MDRQERTETADALDDTASAPDGTETSESSGETTVARRLNRVTRHASGGANTSSTEPPADPGPDGQPASGPEAPAPHEPPPTPAGQQGPAPADRDSRESASAEDAMGQAAAAMPDSPRQPPIAHDAQHAPARGEVAAQGEQAVAEPQPNPPASEAKVEAPPASADAVPEPPAAPAPATQAEPPREPAEPTDDRAGVQHASHGEENRPGAPRDSVRGTAERAAGPPADSPDPAQDDSEKLTVGRGIRLVAKLCECAELLVEGHLEATARTRHLVVAAGGRFIGSAEVDSAEVHGHFEGNLTVANRLFISATGKVAGTTRYQEIVIEAGGQVMGNAQRLPEDHEPGGDGA